MAGELINAEEASKILGYSKRTVARMAADGRLTVAQKLPGLRGNYLFERTHVEEIAARRNESRAS
jgi:excisionase family DNA binding protein